MTSKLTAWLARPSTTMLLVLLGIVAIFAVLSPGTFFTFSNAQGILSNAAILLVVAVGATFVIITAGIDLSVGSVLVFSSVVGAKVMERVGGESLATILVGLLVTILAGGLWGALNGVLIAKAKVPAFVVTLGTLGAAYGLALVISGGVDVRSVPTPLVEFGNGRWLGIPIIALIAAAVTAVAGIALAFTVFGRRTYAIGSNEESARRAGIRVDRHLIDIYALAGALAGFGGFLSLARFGTTTIAGNTNLNLQVITAVVIGGTSLFGGIGWMLGTTIGVFIPIVLANGFIIRGVVPYWQYVAVGAVLVGAVLLDQRRRLRQLN
jgi:ribose transport system permease protein